MEIANYMDLFAGFKLVNEVTIEYKAINSFKTFNFMVFKNLYKYIMIWF